MSDDSMSIDGTSSDGVEIPGNGESSERTDEEIFMEIEKMKLTHEEKKGALLEQIEKAKDVVRKEQEEKKKWKEAIQKVEKTGKEMVEQWQEIQNAQQTLDDVPGAFQALLSTKELIPSQAGKPGSRVVNPQSAQRDNNHGSATFKEGLLKMEKRLRTDASVKEIYTKDKFGKRSCLWDPEGDRRGPQMVCNVPHTTNLVYRSWISGVPEQIRHHFPWQKAKNWSSWERNREMMKTEQNIQQELGIIVIEKLK